MWQDCEMLNEPESHEPNYIICMFVRPNWVNKYRVGFSSLKRYLHSIVVKMMAVKWKPLQWKLLIKVTLHNHAEQQKYIMRVADNVAVLTNKLFYSLYTQTSSKQLIRFQNQ